MNIDKIFPSKYLKASDLGESQPNVVIDRVEFEPVGQQKEMKAVAYFAGKEKGLVLNKTNCRRIAQMAGSGETEDWSGTTVCLFATETEFQGDTVECIRIKPPKATAKKPVSAPVAVVDEDEEIPF